MSGVIFIYFFQKICITNHLVMTEGKFGGWVREQKCDYFLQIHVCNIQRCMLHQRGCSSYFCHPLLSLQQQEVSWARTAICTRCHNGQVYTGGRCVGRPLQGRRGDWLFLPLLCPCTPPGWRLWGPGLRQWCECGHFLLTLAQPPLKRKKNVN